jgi:hypothetical protein
VTISGTGTKTLAANATFRQNLTVSSSTLDLGSFTANNTQNLGTFSVAQRRDVETRRIELPDRLRDDDAGRVEHGGLQRHRRTDGVQRADLRQPDGKHTGGTKTLAGNTKRRRQPSRSPAARSTCHRSPPIARRAAAASRSTTAQP